MHLIHIDSRTRVKRTLSVLLSHGAGGWDSEGGAALLGLVFDAVLFVGLGRVEGLPSRRREDVLVALVPAAQKHFASVRLILLDAGVVGQTDVIVHVEAEERTTFSSGLRNAD